AQAAEHWIDTADMERALVRHQISKHLQWRRNRLALRVPPSLAEFTEMVRLQWEYGYARGLDGLTR
ncbi:hypothetical protein QN353_21200, partial [Undibacterium sp. 10I3]|nr:hypothetical protein [Undibacterium sp. 10I3]